METAVFQKRLQDYWTPERRAKFLSGKSYLLTPWQGGELLFALGLLNKDASMSADATKKFIQINHMLQLLLPSLKQLAKNFPKVRVVDAGCGNAYLSFLIAWYFRDILRHPVELIGIDHSQAMIDRANARALQLGYHNNLKFAVADLQTFSWLSEHHKAFSQIEANLRPHCFVALHACDTATDFALAEALRLKADVIAVAPCCQAELARVWKDQPLSDLLPMSPVMRAPHFRRVVAADMTDMLRTLLLRSRGYEVTATEFVASEHTPKNRLMLATRRGNFLRAAEEEFTSLKTALGEPVLKLEALLKNSGESRASHA
ncbi:MAG: SAM-dependent methyltransferase [Pseudobdellovibrionaceae bacterium]|nr:SAM-dependent methyltransferase [Pseudobdellovibrionaceae bacterium]